MVLTLAKRGPTPKKERVFEIDFFRGLAIFLMILIHGCYSLGYLSYGLFSFPSGTPEGIYRAQAFFQFVFSSITQAEGGRSWGIYSGLMNADGSRVYSEYLLNTNLYALEIFFSGTFMFLSGISCSFSRNNMKRAVQLFVFSLAMTIGLEAADAFFGTDIHIVCGILQSLSIALLLYSCIDHFFPKWWHLALFALPLLALNIAVMHFVYNVGGTRPYLNANEMKTFADFLDAFGALTLGMKSSGDDYFPPILVSLIVLLGGIVGKTIYASKKSILSPDFPKKWATPFLWIGRHTFVIYVLHQIVIIALLAIVMLSLGAKINL